MSAWEGGRSAPCPLAVMDAAIEGIGGPTDLGLSEARAAVAELVEASGAGLSDLLAMVAAADRGEVWTVNAGTRLRLEKLSAALTKCGGAK